MKALYYDELKGYKGIKIGDLPMPEINENEVLVRVKAFSLNHLDVWVMDGKYPVQISLPHIFGSELLSGDVVAARRVQAAFRL